MTVIKAKSWRRLALVHTVILIAVAFFSHAAGADDADIGRLLKSKGAEVVEIKGIVTSLDIQDGSKLTDDEFRRMTHLKHLKVLSLSSGLNEDRFSQLADLADLEYLQTNLAQITDDSIERLTQLKNLKNLKLFHPGKSFSGTGLAHLAEMVNLERLTVAGSLAFNDDGMAAVAKLTRLKEFRTWHCGSTNEGVKRLKDLKHLKSLTLGQRLTYKRPSCPNDDTIAVLAGMKSLESLQIEEARLSFAALLQLKQLPALNKLILRGIDISKKEVERLRGELPQTKIEWTEPNETYQKRIRALFEMK